MIAAIDVANAVLYSILALISGLIVLISLGLIRLIRYVKSIKKGSAIMWVTVFVVLTVLCLSLIFLGALIISQA